MSSSANDAVDMSSRYDALRTQNQKLKRIISIILTGDPEPAEAYTLTDLEPLAHEFYQNREAGVVAPPQNGDKDGKYQAVLDLAGRKWKEQRRSGKGVALEYKEIMGAAECSKRHAYNLMEDMADDVDGCIMGQNPKRLKVDKTYFTDSG